MYTVAASPGPLPPRALLEQQWRELEARSDASFFLSWACIGTWLGNLPRHVRPKLVTATASSGPDAGRLVGLALIVERTIRRRGIFVVRKRLLHTTGNPQIDALMIEYNGVLTDRAHPQAHDAMLRFLAQPGRRWAGNWEELHLPALARSPQANALAASTGCTPQYRSAPTFQVDLDAVRANDGDYLALLHRDTRYQVRRGLRDLAAHGAVTLQAAGSVEQALSDLDALAALHQTVWTARGQAGAFATPAALRFHRQLITQHFASGAVQLLALRVGEQPIGYLYNFVHGGHVYNYQSGLDYAPQWAKSHPGLVAHALAIELNARAGRRVYDFMFGDYRYKRQLCTQQAELHWLELQRPSWKFRLEDALRQRVRAWRAQAARLKAAIKATTKPVVKGAASTPT